MPPKCWRQDNVHRVHPFLRLVHDDDGTLVGGKRLNVESEDVGVHVPLERVVKEVPLLAVEHPHHGVDRLFLIGKFFEEKRRDRSF